MKHLTVLGNLSVTRWMRCNKASMNCPLSLIHLTYSTFLGLFLRGTTIRKPVNVVEAGLVEFIRLNLMRQFTLSVGTCFFCSHDSSTYSL